MTKECWVAAILFLLFTAPILAQNGEKENPVVFVDVHWGGFASESTGLLAGADINYQLNKNLLSLAYVRRMNMEVSPLVIGYMAFPLFLNSLNADEIAVLYGRRFIRNGHSFSFSAGPSYNTYYYRTAADNPWERTNKVGLSIQGNVKWFKKEKKRMRIYYLIPVGKPTSFGLNLGLRLSGNISRTSYAGISLVAGMGWHKKYE